MWSAASQVDYVCEILDGGPKPIFKITPTDNPAAAEVGTVHMQHAMEQG
jgi:hypothetical protein